MTTRMRRADEKAALEAVCALEDVAHHEWLPESNVRTPDLRLTLRDCRVITVEVTLATTDAANSLLAAAETMRPRRARELCCEWTVGVGDHRVAERDSARTLKDFVNKMVTVLAGVESDGGTPLEMQRRANIALDPDCYNPDRRQAGSDTVPWPFLLALDPAGGGWDRDLLVEYCPYWYPLDIVDQLIDGVEPRRVQILRPPVVGPNGGGAIHVHAIAMEPGFFATGVEYLVAALRRAIDKKGARGQMAHVSGEKWLVVALDGNNAAGQLEGALESREQAPHPDLSDIRFPDFDEVWALAKTFHGDQYVVLRLPGSPGSPRLNTVPRS